MLKLLGLKKISANMILLILLVSVGFSVGCSNNKQADNKVSKSSTDKNNTESDKNNKDKSIAENQGAKSYSDINSANPDEVFTNALISAHTHTPKTISNDNDITLSYYLKDLKKEKKEELDSYSKTIIETDEYSKGRDVKIVHKVSKSYNYNNEEHEAYSYVAEITDDEKKNDTEAKNVYTSFGLVSKFGDKWVLISLGELN
ncbi:hypothetical protein [Clostridium sp. C8-1-8]|uniref:hypothetical protein n=1 Tax=Clostridium sp. C8-1-8 TaxID=2698831 RepID=UPI00136CBCAE|nr:hypothetical protein [Clostridium sp. C8-1-8]